MTSASHRNLKLGFTAFVEFAPRARDKNPAGNAAFAVLDPLYDAGRLAALGTIGALGSVHLFFTIGCFCDLGHCSLLMLSSGSNLPLGRGPRSHKNLGVIFWAGATAAGSSCRGSNPYSPELILHEGWRICLVLVARCAASLLPQDGELFVLRINHITFFASSTVDRFREEKIP